MSPTLVIMAAGMGSRFGGLKQISPVGPSKETILDYSMYDAKKAGFSKVVFIIRECFSEEFKEQIHPYADSLFDEVSYVYQTDEHIRKYTKIPENRTKPFGTAVAVLAAKDVVSEPFAVINADDFYGFTTFEALYSHLDSLTEEDTHSYAMAGYLLKNTLSSSGSVARGVCTVTEDHFLSSVTEYTNILRTDKKIFNKCKKTGKITDLDPEDVVSLNTWAFTPSIFDEIENGIPDFIEEKKEDFETAEYFLPSVVDNLIKSGKATVKVLKTKSTWYGVTYKEDLPVIELAISQMIDKGLYPTSLIRTKN